MRVLYLHQYFSTPEGSTGTRSYEFAQRLIANGIDVTMVCGSYDLAHTGLSGGFDGNERRGKVDGIDVIELAAPFSNKQTLIRRAWNFIQFSVRLIPIVISEKYDVVFATSTPLTIAIPALAARWLRQKPMVFEVRDLWPEMPYAMGLIKNRGVLALARLLEKSAYRSSKHCIALSPGIQEGIAMQGIPTERISIIPNGSDNAMANQASADHAEALLANAGVDTTQNLAVFTGAHGVANGLDSLLDAARELQHQNVEDIAIILIGDGSEKPRLQDRATKEGLSNIHFLNPVSKRDLFSVLKRADVGLMLLKNVSAFHRGTSPNKFFDYLSCGLPPLVNYPGWMAEMVEDNECGYVVEPDDPKKFARALIEAVRDENRLEKRSKARSLAEAQFDRDLLGSRFVEVFKNLKF